MSRQHRHPDRYLFTLWFGFILMMSTLVLSMAIMLLALWRQDYLVLLPFAAYLLLFVHRAPHWIRGWVEKVDRHFQLTSR